MRSFLIILIIATTLFADVPSTAVLDFDFQGIKNRSAVEDVQSRFINILQKNEAVKVMSMRKRDSMLERKGVMVPTSCDANCKTELGKALETDYLIIPSLQRDGESMVLSCELFNVSDSKAETVVRNYIGGGISKNLTMVSQEFFQESSVDISGNGLAIGAGVAGGVGVAGLIYYIFFNSAEEKKVDPIVEDITL